MVNAAHSKLLKAISDLQGVSNSPFKRPSPFDGVPIGGTVERFDFELFKTVVGEVLGAGEAFSKALDDAAEAWKNI